MDGQQYLPSPEATSSPMTAASMADSPLTTATKRRWDDSPLAASPECTIAASTDESSERVKRSKPLPEGYPCETCGSIWRTKSDFKKDEARHQRPHKCYFQGCSRVSDGFSTINDLNRHLKGVHRVAVEGAIDYKCLVPGCAKADKAWPRLDNFRQHVARMHPDQDVDLVVQQARQWVQHHASSWPQPIPQRRVTPPRPARSPPLGPTTAGASSSAGLEQFPRYNGPDVRSQSLSSVPGGTPNTDCHFSTPPPGNCQMLTGSYGTPEMMTVGQSDCYTAAANDMSNIGWVQQQDGALVGIPTDPLPMQYSEGLTETGPESYRPEHFDMSLPQNPPPAMGAQLLTAAASPVYRRTASDPYSRRAECVLIKLQLALARSNPPAGNAQDVVTKQGPDSHIISKDGGEDSKDAVFTATDFSGCQDLYFACPFNKHNGIAYAACQSYRARTVGELHLQHILPYHAHRGHIPDPVLARLADLGGSTTSEHWYALYRELFIGEPGVDQLKVPSPFWMPAVSATNLDDLVRAVIDLSGQEVTLTKNIQTTQTTNKSLPPFHLRVQKMCDLINQAANTELAQVQRRWDAISTEALTRLTANSQFDLGTLYDFVTGPPRSQPYCAGTTSGMMVHPVCVSGTEAIAQPISADNSLDLGDYGDYGSSGLTMSRETFPPTTTALPRSFGNRTFEETKWSRRSTPNDTTGYPSNSCCKWLPEDDDPDLCKLCGKTQDLHDIGLLQRQH